MLMRAKVAVIICIIDGHTVVSRDAWEIAGLICNTSTNVRKNLEALAARQSESERQARLDDRAAGAALSALATKGVDARVEAMAKALAKKVHAAGECGRSNMIRSTIRKEFRYLSASVVSLAESRQWSRPR